MTTAQRDRMYAQITAHRQALLSAYPQAAERDPVKLCKRLLRLERQGREIATKYCNGELGSRAVDEAVLPVIGKIREILGPGPHIYINWDARGCCFKIDPKTAADYPAIHRDMGGNGIIAPTFDGN